MACIGLTFTFLYFLLVKDVHEEIVLSTGMGRCELLYSVIQKEEVPNEYASHP